MELDYKAIGQRMKAVRIRRRMTQDQLAEMTGLSNPHISNVETGSTKVSLPSLVKISNALEVSIDELLCDSIERAKDIFAQEIMFEIKDCNETEIRFLTDALKSLKSILRKRGC